MEKGYLETIAGKLEEGWPKARVARALKGLGLKRGALTDAQVGNSHPESFWGTRLLAADAFHAICRCWSRS